jgi:hypothetical protein
MFFFFNLLLSFFQSLTLYLLLHFDDELWKGTKRIRTTVQLISCHRVTRNVLTQYLLSQITWPCTHVSALDNKSDAYMEGRPSVRHECSRFRPFSVRTNFCLQLPALVTCGNITHLIPDRVAQ